ncbi:MAG TPA: CHAP domain-containing protein [Polyangia bacterium]|jgi:hypothetical protein
MASKYWVAIAAWGEQGKNWRENTDQILGYFSTSTNQSWTRDNARKISWCTYFAHWCLVQAGVSPLPDAGTSDSLKDVGGSVGRFLKYTPKELTARHQTGNGAYPFHAVASGTYQPKAGDLYYLPNHNNHVGVIVGVSGNSIWTVDGNAGPGKFDARFYVSYDKNGAPVKRIGDGFIYFSGVPKTLGKSDFYIEIPD